MNLSLKFSYDSHKNLLFPTFSHYRTSKTPSQGDNNLFLKEKISFEKEGGTGQKRGEVGR
jgi:hypothetical protein